VQLHLHEQGDDSRGSVLLHSAEFSNAICKMLISADRSAGLCVFRDGVITSQVRQSELTKDDEMIEERIVG
jgi:hypothetical protein